MTKPFEIFLNRKSKKCRIFGYVDDSDCWIATNLAKDKDGYARVWYNQRDDRLHRAVYENFYNCSASGFEVTHICDTPSCSNPMHLTLDTHFNNMRGKVERGRQPRGTDIPASKLTDEQVIRIKLDTSHSVNEKAEMYSVSTSCIRAILKGKTWKHIVIDESTNTFNDIAITNKRATNILSIPSDQTLQKTDMGFKEAA